MRDKNVNIETLTRVYFTRLVSSHWSRRPTSHMVFVDTGLDFLEFLARRQFEAWVTSATGIGCTK